MKNAFWHWYIRTFSNNIYGFFCVCSHSRCQNLYQVSNHSYKAKNSNKKNKMLNFSFKNDLRAPESKNVLVHVEMNWVEVGFPSNTTYTRWRLKDIHFPYAWIQYNYNFPNVNSPKRPFWNPLSNTVVFQVRLQIDIIMNLSVLYWDHQRSSVLSMITRNWAETRLTLLELGAELHPPVQLSCLWETDVLLSDLADSPQRFCH